MHDIPESQRDVIQTRFDAVARRPRARQPDDPAIRGRERPHFGAVEALPLPAPRRVASVDAVRGFTMFWIIGADGAAKALAEVRPATLSVATSSTRSGRDCTSTTS